MENQRKDQAIETMQQSFAMILQNAVQKLNHMKDK